MQEDPVGRVSDACLHRHSTTRCDVLLVCEHPQRHDRSFQNETGAGFGDVFLDTLRCTKHPSVGIWHISVTRMLRISRRDLTERESDGATSKS